jgi:hypothetical protein
MGSLAISNGQPCHAGKKHQKSPTNSTQNKTETVNITAGIVKLIPTA